MTSDFRRLREVAHNFGIRREETAGVAVSGGSDSLAMLLLLHEKGWSLEAATVDHGLRPEAADEAAFVAELCAGLGIPHATLKVDLTDAAGNLQDQARRARYAALKGWAKERGIKHVALGHTMDDQAETFLMRLARGSGLDGLSGMREWWEEDGINWLRPFLTSRRSELRSYLEHKSVNWLDDPSNEDDRFERVRMRKAMHTLEPLGITPAKIWEACFKLRDVRSELDYRAQKTFLESGREDFGDLVIPKAALKHSEIGHETRRRLIVAGLLWVSGADYPPRQEEVSNVNVAIGKSETRTLSGCLVTSKDDVRFAREYNAVKDTRCATKQLWDGRWALEGEHAKELEVRALGEAVNQCPDWRDTGIPRQSLLASPAIWHESTLVSAPLAGFSNGWTAKATGRGNFADFLLSR